MKRKWTVLASRVGAGIYTLNNDKKPERVYGLSYPLGRFRNHSMLTDKPGLSRSKFKGAASPHRITMKDPHDQAADQFAQKLGKYLKKQWGKKKFSELQIVAEAKFLGKIKKSIPKSLKIKIEWIAKDLNKMPEKKWSKIIEV